MTAYLVNTKTDRKFKVLALDKEKNVLKLEGPTGGKFDEPFDKERLKALGYTMQQIEE